MKMNQKTKISATLTAALAGTALLSQTASAAEMTDYTVQKGDNLYRLAIQYNTTVDEIVAANGIVNKNLIRVNQELSIPTNTKDSSSSSDSSSDSSSSGSSTSSTGYHQVQSGETLSTIAAKYGVTTNQLATWNKIGNIHFIRTGWVLQVSASGSSSGGSSSGSTSSGTVAENQYVVQAGDNLYRLAIRFGTTVEQLAAWNNISNTRLIYTGDVLTVSGASTKTAEATVDDEVETTVATESAVVDDVVVETSEEVVEAVTEEVVEAPVTEEVVEVPVAVETSTEATVEVEVVETVVEVPAGELTEVETLNYTYTEPVEEVEVVEETVAFVQNQYTVLEDTTIFHLAALFNASVSDLLQWNNIEDSNDIKAGTVLRISL